MSSNFFAALDDSGDEAPTVHSGSRSSSSTSKANHAKKPVGPEQSPRKASGGGRSGNDRNTKFGRGGRHSNRDGKRAYDRRSGTGRGKEISKGGGGAHNWGSYESEAQAGVRDVYESNNNHRGDATDYDEEDNNAAPPAPVVDNTMSYDEFLAKKKEGASGLLAPVKERTTNDNAFASVTATALEETDFLVLGAGKSKRKKAGKKVDTAAAAELLAGMRVESNANNTSSSSGRGEGRGGRGGRDGRGRGGRGRGDGRGRGGRDGRGRGGRGGGGRGRGGREGSGRFAGGRSGGGRGGRGGRSGGLNVQDETAFPSL